MSHSLLITKARMVNEGRSGGDLLVVDGRIAQIGGAISAPVSRCSMPPARC